MNAIIVRRDMSAEYYFFLEAFARANGFTVMVDRRVAERRHGMAELAVERRRFDRRGPTPATWLQADCVVVELPGPAVDRIGNRGRSH